MKVALRRVTIVIMALFLVAGAASFLTLLGTEPAQAAPPIMVTVPTDSGGMGAPGELRWAINMANSTPGPDDIIFNIGMGPVTISLASPLPPITETVNINGYTEPGSLPPSAGNPAINFIRLEGGMAIPNGLWFMGPVAAGSTVRGLALGGFAQSGVLLDSTSGVILQANNIGFDAISGPIPNGNGVLIMAGGGHLIGGTFDTDRNTISFNFGDGVLINGSGGSQISGNSIGADFMGAGDVGNWVNGISVNGSGNIIGGNPAAGLGNVISGNDGDGVLLSSGTSGNTVQGNRIGTDVSGTADLGNASAGIYLDESSSNTIGGTGLGNIVVCNDEHGILLEGATLNTMTGNYVGTNAAGDDLGNHYEGIALFNGANSNTIGGAVAGNRNIISCNDGGGIVVGASTGSVIQANYVGSSAAGDGLGNNSYGIYLTGGADGSTIEANLVSGNSSNGVVLESNGNVLEANYIGTDAAGTGDLGNGENGVVIGAGATGNTIGGDAGAGEGNLISGNAYCGIYITGSNNNTVSGNLIGTDLNGTYVVGNDDLGNGIEGVNVTGSSSNTIGGAAADNRNVISGNASNGVLLYESTNCGIYNNYIGTDATGTGDLGNAGDGINSYFNSPSIANNYIGAAGQNNLISGNDSDGIEIYFSMYTYIQGNYIGTDAAGTADLGNTNHGINFRDFGDYSAVGGTGAGQGNLISGNGGHGIYAYDTYYNSISGNRIGTNAAGTAGLGNGLDGIYQGNCRYNSIGGSGAGYENLISGNTANGIELYFCRSGSVQGNYIGTDAAGAGAIGNGSDGIIAIGDSDTYIGGSGAGQRNLVSGNAGDGIELSSCGSDFILGNYIGTDVTGTADLGNVLYGVNLDNNSSDIRVGGAGAGEGNLISGNNWAGVHFDTCISCYVWGNFIGTDVNGTATLSNNNGMAVLNSSSIQIGGGGAGEGNLISCNMNGIYFENADANTVQGNLIGTDINGTADLGNHLNGIRFFNGSDSNIVGGSTPELSNVISGNSESGVLIEGSDGNTVLGNLIGTDPAGTAAMGNGGRGVFIYNGADNNVIGGTDPGEGNVIADNQQTGVAVGNGDGNAIHGNFIGTDAGGTLDLGNGADGVRLIGSSDNNVVGDDVTGQGNFIRFNAGAGVNVLMGSTGNFIEYNAIEDNAGIGVAISDDASYLNRVSHNAVYNNGGLAIDLMADGVTPNDGNNDNPAKANRGYNFPVFSSPVQPVASGIVTVTGTAPPNAHVEFYWVGPAQDPSGHGESLAWVGSTDADPAGDFFCNLAGTGLVAGDYISAIAISPAGDLSGEGNTSEFSENAQVVPGFAIDASVNGGNGTVDPGYQAVLAGETASVDIVPDTGYHLFFITDNAVPMPLADPYVITNVNEDHDVVVIYDIDKYDVNAYVTGGHGSVSPAGQSVAYGGTATVDITPDSGYMIESITDNDVPVAGPFTDPYTYTIDPVTEVHNVVVTFAASAFDVNATVFFGGGDVNPAYQSVAYDGTASVDLIPDTGYHAAYILDNGASVAVADPYVINNVMEDHSVVVLFELDTYTITASVEGNGSVSGAGDYQYGSTATLIATPDAGWSFADWTEDAGGTVVSTDMAYSFTVTGDWDLTAHFTYPWVNSVMPKYMAAPGPVSVVLNGSGFLPGATVRLTRMGSPDVAATNVGVVSPTEITCDFDLTGTATGAWNLSFENPDGGWNSLHGCFFAGSMSGTGWGYNGNGQLGIPDENDFAALVGGTEFSLALRLDGTLAAWGRNIEGQCDVPAGNGFLAISAGDRHGLALRSDGTIAAWGYNNYGQVSGAPTDNGYVAVSGGYWHSLALRSDGSLVSWGYNGGGQVSNTPAGNDFVAISAGHNHSLALRADGSLVAWGWNDYNQCNVPAGNDFVAVEGGWGHSLALRADGSLIAWGLNDNGQCNVPAGNDFVSIEAGSIHSLALRADGSLAAWGGNGFNQVSDTPAGNEFTAISGDFFHNLALCRPFEVNASAGGGGGGAVDPGSQRIGFGRNATIDLLPDANYHVAGITDNGVPRTVADPYVISNVREPHDVVVDFALDTYTITATVVGNGSADGAGDYDYGSTATLIATPDTGWHFVNWTEDAGGTVVSTDAAYSFPVTGDWDLTAHFAIDTFAVNASVFYTGHGAVDPASQTIDYGSPASIDLVPAVGYYASYVLDNGVPVTVADPYVIGSVTEAHNVIAFFAPNPYTITASVDPAGSGSVSGAGTYDYGSTANLNAMPAAGWHFINWTEGGTEVSTDAAYSFTVTGDRALVAHFATAVVISAMPKYSGDADSIHFADLHGSGFLPGATVKLTRAGSTEINATGVVVVSDTQISCDLDLAGAATGAWNVTVINPDGGSGYLANAFFVGTMSGTGWGADWYGQADFPAGIDFVQVSAGEVHSTALRSDGHLLTWGDDSSGQVSNTPIYGGFVQIATGYYHSLALNSSGIIDAWGFNDDSQVSGTPTGPGFVAIAAGGYHSLTLLADGSILSWGNDDYGQCSNTPAGNDFVAIAGGYQHSLALRADGSLAAWGDDTYGQCSVPAGNDFVAVAGGTYHSLALRSDGSLVAWGDNAYGQVGSTPAGNDFIQIAAGEWHNLALRADGSIAAWGADMWGQVGGTPTGNDFVQVSGGTHSLALCRPYKVAASVGGGGGGAVDPTYQRMGYGRTATIDLIPDTHWHVASITDNGVPVPSPYGSTYVISNIRENHDVVVTFALDTYDITAAVDGSGTVDGAGTYGWGTEATLTATPDTGWHFVNWTEDAGGTVVSTDPVLSFTVTGDWDLTAHFAIDTFDVNASVYYTGHGTVDPLTQTIDYGSPASITLTPETGYHVAWITDNGIPVAGPYSATYVIPAVAADHTVIVTFAINVYDVTASVSGGHGTVDPAAQVCDWGTKAEIDLIPEEGYHIASITDNGTPATIADPYIISNVTADHDVVVTFAINTYAINASVSGGHGTVDPATQTVDWGTDASIDVTPAAHYHIATITDNGASKPVASPYVISSAKEAHNVVATFAIDTTTWYLAEGCTAGGIETWVLVENPNDYPVTINTSFATSEGLMSPSSLQGYVVAANSRVSFNAGSYVETYQVSTIISAMGGEIICERAMYGNGRTWGTDSIGTKIPADTWYLAEGCTGPGFETWVLVMNPGDSAVTVDLDFMTSTGSVAGPQNVSIPAKSRKSFNLGEYVTDYNVSTLVGASGEVVAERAMYGSGRTWAHNSIGTSAPAPAWYLAEGSTGAGFETWVLVQNPGTASVTVDLTLMTGAGKQNPPVLQDVSIPAKSRISFNLGDYVTDYDVSTLVASTGGDVIAERSMYDTGHNWGTCSIGAVSPATTWYLAEGSTGAGFETWVLVQNPGTASVTVDLSFLTSTGAVAGPQDVTIPAGSRMSFNLGDYVTDYNVSTEVVSTGAVVCERAMYGDGRVWAHDSVGYTP